MDKNLETIHVEGDAVSMGALAFDIQDPDDSERIVRFGKALGSPVRVAILQALQKKMMNYSELSRLLDLPVGTIAFHIQMLQDADLVTVGNYPEHKGHIRWCSYKYSAAFLRVRGASNRKSKSVSTYKIGIGDYSLFEPFGDEWGFAFKDLSIYAGVKEGFPYPPNRSDIRLLWCAGGRIEYPVPTQLFQNKKIKEVRISLEISSYTVGYNRHYPSEIIYTLNGVELCSDVSQGDYGDRYGLITPAAWNVESSKYGVLKTITVRSDGVYLNEALVNKKADLSVFDSAENTLFFKIENKSDGRHPGGFNLFGETFGDYPQAINIDVFCD